MRAAIASQLMSAFAEASGIGQGTTAVCANPMLPRGELVRRIVEGRLPEEAVLPAAQLGTRRTRAAIEQETDCPLTQA